VTTIWSHPANRSQRARVLARALLAQARWRLTGRPTAVRFSATTKVLAHFDGGSSQRAAYAPLPDYAEMNVWRRFLRPGDLFVDVGANAGLYTLLACERGCEVVAVEPLASMVTQLERNLRLNGYRADIVQAVLGSGEGTARLGSEDGQRAHIGAGRTKVTMTTLDAVLGDRHARGVKIDVEGAERMVLEGSQRALRERRIELIQLEWNDRSEVNYSEPRDRVAQLLFDHGYELAAPSEAGELAAVAPRVGSDLFARRPPSTDGNSESRYAR